MQGAAAALPELGVAVAEEEEAAPLVRAVCLWMTNVTVAPVCLLQLMEAAATLPAPAGCVSRVCFGAHARHDDHQCQHYPS